MTAIEKVLEAAEQRGRQLLAEAAEYEKLARRDEAEHFLGHGESFQQKIADLAYREHYKPLANAIAEVKAGM